MAIPRILIADKATVARRLARELRQAGYDVPAVAVSGEEAVTLARQLQPDLAIVAVELAGNVNGIDAAARIRADGDVPIIYSSSPADEHLLERAQATEPYGHVLKPFRVQAIRLTIDLALHRRNLERRLRASEQQYVALVDRSLQGMMILQGPPPRIAFANPRCVEFLEYSLDELLSMSPEVFAGMVCPADRELLFARLADHLVGRREQTRGKFRALRKDGAIRWIQYFASGVQYGGAPSIQVALLDITEQMQVQEALRLSEERFRLALENANVGMCQVDLEGRITQVNGRMCKILGYSRQELEGKTVNDITLPDDRHVTSSFIHAALAGASTYAEYEKRYIHKQGHTVTCLVSSSLATDAEGRPAYLISHVLDVTTEHKAQEALRRAHADLESQVEKRTADLHAANLHLRQEIAEHQRTEQHLRRANRALALLTDGTQVVARATTEQKLMDNACRMVVGTGGYRMAWIGLAEHDQDRTVRPVARAGAEAGYAEMLHLTWADTGRGREPTGTAIRTGQSVAVRNIHTDSTLASWRAQATAQGYASSLALPLIVDGQAIGVLSVYAAEPDAFEPAEVELLQRLADELAFGVAALRTRACQQEAEARLRYQADLIENVSDAVVATDNDLVIRSWNRAATEIYGWPAGEVIGRPLREILQVEHATARFEVASEQLLSHGKWEGEMTHRRRDGIRLQIRASTSLLRDLAGQGTGAVSIYRDVTARRQAEAALAQHAVELEREVAERRRTQQALQESEARYRSIFENATLGIYRTTPDGKVLVANPALVRMLGFDSDEGLIDRDLVVGYVLRRRRAHLIEQIEREGQVAGIKSVWNRRDGSSLFIRESARALRDEAGQTLYYEGAVEDITEQVRAEEQLRAYTHSLEEVVLQRTHELQSERDRTRALLESVGEAVIVTDLQDCILYLNPVAASVVGISREEAMGQSIRAWREERPHEAKDAIRAALAAGHAWRGEVSICHADRVWHDVAVTVAPLIDTDAGQLVGAVRVERDISALKEIDRMKDMFISNMSHELRTPLSVITLISGNLDALYDRLDDDRRLKMIRDLRGQVRVLNDLIGDVLEVSRIDSRRVSMERARADLADVARAEIENQMPLAESKSQRLAVAAAGPLPVWGNRPQLLLVARNLVNNALKYTAPGGVITCGCCVLAGQPAAGEAGWPGSEALPPGRWAALRVVDTGVGIDAQDLPYLFDRFYRGAALGQTPGTGLGLSIALELVQLHGGQIAVASTPGEGSTFAVYLPLLEEKNNDGR